MTGNPVCCLCGQPTEGDRPTLLYREDNGVNHHICRDCHQALYDLTCTKTALEAESAIAAVMRRMTATSEAVEAYVHENVFAVYAQGAPARPERSMNGEEQDADAPIEEGAAAFMDDLSASAQTLSARLRVVLRLTGRDSALQRIVLFSAILVAVVLLIGLPMLLIIRLHVHPLPAILAGLVITVYFVSRALLSARRGNNLEALLDELRSRR